jgi:acyl carrier protein
VSQSTTGDADDLRQRIVALLAEELDPALMADGGPDDDTSLFDEMGLDSAGTMRLVAGLEDEFEIEVPDEDLVRSNFATVGAILDYVRRRGGV